MEDPKHIIPVLPQEALDKIKHKFLDVPYCEESPAQVLDIFLPETPGPYPVIVHFHGGAFMFGTQRDINLVPMLRGLDKGFAIISVSYRMSGEARFPAMIYDAKAAIRFIRANALHYHLDTDKIGVWGPSAGGYIVSMLGATNDEPVFEDLDMGNASFSSAVQSVVDWCGPSGNFLEMDPAIKENGFGVADHNDPLSPESRFMGAPILTIPELVRLATPATHLRKNLPIFMIHHGEADPIVPVQQSITFADAIIKAGGHVILETFSGKGHHGNPWYEEEEMSDKVFEFFNETLRQ
jgi:acetyl esterase/lipase